MIQYCGQLVVTPVYAIDRKGSAVLEPLYKHARALARMITRPRREYNHAVLMVSIFL